MVSIVWCAGAVIRVNHDKANAYEVGRLRDFVLGYMEKKVEKYLHGYSNPEFNLYSFYYETKRNAEGNYLKKHQALKALMLAEAYITTCASNKVEEGAKSYLKSQYDCAKEFRIFLGLINADHLFDAID